MEAPPEDVQATFAATLVDEWVRCGVDQAVVAPGSRSTPLALALAAHPGMAVEVHHDERSAGFLAVGLSLGTGAPVVVLTTSGTAAVELHPAVVEADLARVPIIVCTADRPPELQDVGAPQAIDQSNLFGRSVRWFHAPGVPDGAASDRWRAIAGRAVAAATGPAAGPVHLNLAFREPLLGRARPLPSAASGIGAHPRPRTPSSLITGPALTMVDELVGRRGVIVAGPGSGPGRPIDAVARALGWPVLAAPQAPVWGVSGAVIPCADAVVRTHWLSDVLRPEVVVRLGMPMASKEIGRWIAASGCDEVVVAGPGRWIDPAGTADVVLPAEPAAVLAGWSSAVAGIAPVADGAWLAAWREAGATAAGAVDDALAGPGPTEPGIARTFVAAMPEDGELVVSSSMPVRDVEWYAQPRTGLRVHANRGANGIDGVVSTAVGVAVGTRRPTGLLIGDLAFLHDANGLLGVSRRGIDLVVVVVDNDGGGIFSFLSQADALDPARFEELFGTPHGLDLVALAAAHGVTAAAVHGDLADAVTAAVAAGGVHVLVVRTDRAANVAVHEQLHAAVGAALGPPP